MKLKRLLTEREAVTERKNVENAWSNLLKKEAEYVKALADLRTQANIYAQAHPDKSDKWNLGVSLLQKIRDHYLYKANRNRVGSDVGNIIKKL